MNYLPVIKIEIFILEQNIERLRNELSQVGLSHIGNYDHCISITDVSGLWRPIAGAAS